MIEKLDQPTSRQRSLASIGRLLRAASMATSLAAGGGLAAGSLTQQYSREMTGFDPKAFQELTTSLDVIKKKKTEDIDISKGSTSSLQSFIQSFKKGDGDFTKIFQNSESYLSMRLEWQKRLKSMDDASFAIPALYTFVTLLVYLTTNLLNRFEKLKVRKQHSEVREVINQMIDKLNKLSEEAEETTRLLKSGTIGPEDRKRMNEMFGRLEVLLAEADELPPDSTD